MIFDDDHDDNFLNSEHIEAAEKEEQQRREQPDPDYINFTGPARQDKPVVRRHARAWIIAAVVVIAILGVIYYIRYGNPYITDARAAGVLTGVEKRGVIFKTYEGLLIPDEPADSATAVTSRGLSFSVESDSLADRLQKYQLDGHPVIVTYKKYMGVLPWRGSSTTVVTAVQPR